jgi:hypothetical protein
MKFELNDHHRNVPTEDLIADIKRVAMLLNKKTFTMREYVGNGKYSHNTLLRRIGSWKECLKKADLVPPVNATGVTDVELIEDLKQVAELIGFKYLSRDLYGQHGKYSASVFERRIGSWTKCLEMIGISTLGMKKNASKEELFKNLEEVWVKLGRQPGYQDMHAPLSKFSGKPYMIRFGSWRKGLEEFVKFVNQGENSKSEKPSGTVAEVSLTPEVNSLKHKTSRDINWRIKFLVMRRDNFKCRICGKSPAKNPEVELHVDHIKAWTKGGETTFENLQTLCSVCNIGKSDLDMHD